MCFSHVPCQCQGLLPLKKAPSNVPCQSMIHRTHHRAKLWEMQNQQPVTQRVLLQGAGACASGVCRKQDWVCEQLSWLYKCADKPPNIFPTCSKSICPTPWMLARNGSFTQDTFPLDLQIHGLCYLPSHDSTQESHSRNPRELLEIPLLAALAQDSNRSLRLYSWSFF